MLIELLTLIASHEGWHNRQVRAYGMCSDALWFEFLPVGVDVAVSYRGEPEL